MKKEIKKYLGIDWGLSRIGTALGDSETKMAFPFKTVYNLKEILELIEIENIDEIVLGKPLKMSGSSQLNNDFKKFSKELENKIEIPFKYIDERLSSKASDALVGDKKTKASRDEISAMLILQSYFDQIKNESDL